jgi:geranylgeranyl pyrophosphate synthase
MVHLATLVHDDVMDEAEIRRGQLTVAANWGNEIAVLFGDCLFAQALKLAASFPTPEVCRAVAMATNTVCTGEILQTQHRRNFNFAPRLFPRDRNEDRRTVHAFVRSGGIFGEAKPEQRAALREFGAAFGTAYQVYDDCVDLFGSEADAGKSLGTDLAKGKLTWPLLLAWERANASRPRASGKFDRELAAGKFFRRERTCWRVTKHLSRRCRRLSVIWSRRGGRCSFCRIRAGREGLLALAGFSGATNRRFGGLIVMIMAEPAERSNLKRPRRSRKWIWCAAPVAAI